MTDQKNPSQEEPSKGVFDPIQGAKSRDPDVVEEPEKEPETAAAAEPAKESGEAAKPGDERLGKALQRTAQLERKIIEYGGWADFGKRVAAEKEELVQRYQQGQPLFVDEDEEPMTASEAQKRVTEKPLTRQEFADTLDQREAGQRLAGELNAIAEEQLPEFRKLSRSQDFVEMLDWARRAAWNGGIPLDESVASWDNEVAAKEYTAIKKAYTMKLASDPKVLEASKKAGEKQQQERDAEAAAVPSPTGTSTTSSQEEPGEKSEAEKIVERTMKARGLGKPFSTIGSKGR